MSQSCHLAESSGRKLTARYRRALWIALAMNAVMFMVEFGASLRAESVSLLADAVDFAGDVASYGLSLGALALGAAAGVVGTGSGLPDLVVAAAMAVLAVSAGLSTVRQARGELAPVHAH